MLNNQYYTFASWSDNGAATHDILTPQATQTYTATFAFKGTTTPPLYCIGCPSPSVSELPTPAVTPDGLPTDQLPSRNIIQTLLAFILQLLAGLLKLFQI
jgi:hypothetical protein